MSKRSAVPKNINSIKSAKQPKHWSLGLLQSMKDPELIVKRTDRVVVIRDKYPKAKIHYLVLPEEDISSIYKLNSSHVALLEEFASVYEEIIAENKDHKLQAGFHAIPSMQRLHMHIISNDMVSPCMKTKIHWNTFTTDFFLPYEDVLKEINSNGCIKKMTKEMHEKYITTPLKCNQCDFQPRNMPQLKEHLLSHCKT